MIDLFNFMYIYLDESYNLKDRDKKQFVSVNGFMVADVRFLFKNEFEYTNFKFVFQPSATNVLLELADFYSNIFYRAYMNDDESFLRDCRPRIYQLKNPLNILTDVLE